jgi:anti-sigma factor RsiW
MPERPHEHADDENLVAYLDGELDEDDERAVEALLGRDGRARAEADSLKRAWDMLDYLARPEPSPSFTSQTLERISGLRTAVAPKSPTISKRRAWATGVVWTGLVVVAGALGFGSVRLYSKPPPPKPPPADLDERLVRHLWVIENQHLYEQVDDIQFLKKLASPELFGDDT